MFPGQGCQKPGMLRLLDRYREEVREVFDLAGDLAGRDIADLCLTAGAETLGKTINTQIAVTAMNLAYLKLLQNRQIQPDIVMGQSLGQFACLAACRSMSYEDVFRLVLKRAELMDSIERPGVLCSILGFTLEQVREILAALPEDSGIVEIALINGRTQIVLGGEERAVDLAAEQAMAAGAYKTVKIRVSAAFHTSFMKGIEQELSDFIDTLPVEEPCCRIILNCKGDYADSADEIRRDLKLATCHTVNLFSGIERLLSNDALCIAEAGVGKAMAGMLRNMGYKDKVYLLSELKDFDQYIKRTTG